MYLKELQLYPIKVISNDNVLFDGISDNLPSELKDYEIKNVDFVDNKLVLNI